MKSWRKLMTISPLFFALVAPSMQPQEAFKAKELLRKDLGAYAGGDLVLSVGEIAIARGRRFMKTRTNFTFPQKTGAKRSPLAFSSTTLATKANH